MKKNDGSTIACSSICNPCNAALVGRNAADNYKIRRVLSRINTSRYTICAIKNYYNFSCIIQQSNTGTPIADPYCIIFSDAYNIIIIST